MFAAARETVHLDNGTGHDDKIVEDNKTALSGLFKEVRNNHTPRVTSRIVDDIDKIAKAMRFPR